MRDECEGGREAPVMRADKEKLSFYLGIKSQKIFYFLS